MDAQIVLSSTALFQKDVKSKGQLLRGKVGSSQISTSGRVSGGELYFDGGGAAVTGPAVASVCLYLPILTAGGDHRPMNSSSIGSTYAQAAEYQVPRTLDVWFG
jgi:hypothetical protein